MSSLIAFFLGFPLYVSAGLVFAEEAPRYELRLHIIALADDANGTNATTTTPAQIADFTNLANQVFASANVRFTFDPKWDWTTLIDRDLNQNLDAGNSGNNWGKANQIAARYPGKIVVFLRNRAFSNFAFVPNTGQSVPVDSPTPPLFPNFIAFLGDSAGAQRNRQNFSHELGHFLGLYHPHLGWGNDRGTTDADIESLQRSRGANALDGDLIADTPQDPGPTYWKNKSWAFCDPARPSTTVGGVTYTPDRANVMGYFACNGGTNLTAGQAAAIRRSLEHPSRNILTQRPCHPDFHKFPVSDFQLCFDYWTSRGLWPQTLTVSPNARWLSGSFQGAPFRGEVRHLMRVGTYDQKTAAHDANNWAPRNVNTSKRVSLFSTTLLYTAMWQPSGGSDVVTLRDMTESQFNTRWHALYNQGYIQTDWFIYVHNGALRMHATWVKIPSFQGFAAYYGLTWNDFLTKNNLFTADGLRIDHFLAYISGGVTRYAAIWVPTSEVRLVSRSSSSSEYQSNYNRLAGTFGYRLHHIHSYGADQYTAVWNAPHGLCTTGSKLAPESEACVTRVCQLDSFCCQTEWDGQCVQSVKPSCGLSCP